MDFKLLKRLEEEITNKINNFYKNNYNCYNSDHLDLSVRFELLQLSYNDLVAQYNDDKKAWLEFKIWWFEKKQSKSTSPSKNYIHSLLIDEDDEVKEPFSLSRDKSNLARHLSKPLRPSNNLESSPSSSTTAQSPSSSATESTSASPVKRKEAISKHINVTPPKKAKWDSDDELTPTSIKYLDYHNNKRLKFNGDDLRKLRRKSDNNHEQNPFKNKGSGRYATSIPKTDENQSINKLYPINPDNNKGLNYKYNETVRNKEERKHMIGGDCFCCRDFWNSVGEGTAQEHRDRSSRHRSHWPRAKTPPGYWDVDFPSTQKIAQNKEQAREMHKEKRIWVAAEADKDDGRHIRSKSSS
ncbi:hypothetical protein E3P84_00026 [Wallemia ichthyophaga]|nr:hypothetical protein E3P84_00026 [Wallemia ichthyophaga]TIB44713.1 hypothetical protein E3P83_00026 [Wallemia ichthyophaga]